MVSPLSDYAATKRAVCPISDIGTLVVVAKIGDPIKMAKTVMSHRHWQVD